MGFRRKRSLGQWDTGTVIFSLKQKKTDGEEEQKYPEQTQGAWIEKGWPIDDKSVVLTEGDHGYIECRTKDHRVFEEKHYLAPIPQGQIDLNPNLTQNPGWE